MPDRRIALVKRAYAAFEARDLDTLVALSTEDVEVSTLTGLLAGRSGPYRGREALQAYLDDVLEVWEELELRPVDFFELSDGKLLVFGRIRARQGGGRMIDMPSAWLWEIEGDKVATMQVFTDLAQAHELVPASTKLSV